jgi:ferrochelatase
VEIPRFVWWPILYGIVLNTRPKASAAKYERIWTPDGSPLRVHTERQAKLVRGYLGQRQGSAAPLVEFAMRYGEPSIASRMAALARTGATHVLVLPLYPQYSASTTASVHDALEKSSRTGGPLWRVVENFHDDAGYVGAVAAQIREARGQRGAPERWLMSFHGLPQRAVDRGDPYRRHCEATARAVAAQAGLAEGSWALSFQSRFGAAEWLKPYTDDVLTAWAREGVKSVNVVCPGFVSDCLETLDEIGRESRHAFLEGGGREFHLLPCLNERHDWIEALLALASSEFEAWLGPDFASGRA